MLLCAAAGVKCGDFAAADWTTKRQPKYAERTTSTQGDKFGDKCSAQCVDGFYENPDDASDNRTPLEYTCKAPAADLGAMGAWASTNRTDSDKAPDGCQPGTVCDGKHGGLQCLPGKLHVPNANQTSNNPIREKSEPIDYTGDAEILKACKFGGASGPQYEFFFTARDVQNNPRQYDNLKESDPSTSDYVVAKIERVKVESLPAGEQEYQPRGSNPEPDAKLYDVEKGLWKEGPARTYWKQKLNSIEHPDHVQYANKPGKDGQWKISHQFTEHGVFYVSIFICPNTDSASREPCDKFSLDQLVPGTGEPNSEQETQPEANATNVFTVCPQGTVSSNMQKQVVKGSQLRTCQAQSGCFSVLGPGRIASSCPDGFQCNFVGATWPVAEPGYWVGEYYATTFNRAPRQWSRVPETLSCKSLGACPGSIAFLTAYKDKFKKDICPADTSTNWTMSNFDGFVPPKSGAFGQESCFVHPEPNDRNGMPSSCENMLGSRCCMGNTGTACEECCGSTQGGTHDDRNPSCNQKQWHQVTTGEGKYCQPCPETTSEGSYALAVVGIILFIFFAPITAKLAEVAQHAGAVQGPFLSLMNFLQSSGEKIQHFFLNFLFIKNHHFTKTGS